MNFWNTFGKVATIFGAIAAVLSILSYFGIKIDKETQSTFKKVFSGIGIVSLYILNVLGYFSIILIFICFLAIYGDVLNFGKYTPLYAIATTTLLFGISEVLEERISPSERKLSGIFILPWFLVLYCCHILFP